MGREITIRLDSRLILDKRQLLADEIVDFKDEYTRGNPKFFRMKKMGFSTYNTPPKLKSFEIDGNFIILPRGTLGRTRIYFEEKKIRTRIVDETVELEPVQFRIDSNFVIRSYQREAVEALVTGNGGVVRGPCGSGKTTVALVAIARLAQPAIVIVHTKALLDQWKLAVQNLFHIQPYIFSSSKNFKFPKNEPYLMIATQQSLHHALKRKGNEKIFENFGTVVADEVHHQAANSFYAVSNNFPCKYRIGVSADERRKDGLEFLIYETYGEVKYTIRRPDLIEDGKLLPLRIEFVATQYVDEVFQQCRNEDVTPDWVNFISQLTLDDQRKLLVLLHACRVLGVPCEENGIPERERLMRSFEFLQSSHVSLVESIFSAPRYNMLSMASKKSMLTLANEVSLYSQKERKNNRILILSERIESCKEYFLLFEAIGIPSGLLLGGPENKAELMRTIAGLQIGSIRVGIGTTVADEGLDIPPLTHVFCTCPVHQHPKRMEQMVGRAARPYDEKEIGTCLYLWDRKIFPGSENPGDDMERAWIKRVSGAVGAKEIFIYDRAPGKKKRGNGQVSIFKNP